MVSEETTSPVPVRKTVMVKATQERAFRVFTSGIDAWWPRSHHIGEGVSKGGVLEGWPGGRCYSIQEDDAQCDWGSILVWEPPQRFVMAWKVSPDWRYEPDLAKASEVEVRFTAEEGGFTRVDLEHRHFERHGAGVKAMRDAVDSPGGWNGMLQLYRAEAERVEREEGGMA